MTTFGKTINIFLLKCCARSIHLIPHPLMWYSPQFSKCCSTLLFHLSQSLLIHSNSVDTEHLQRRLQGQGTGHLQAIQLQSRLIIRQFFLFMNHTVLFNLYLLVLILFSDVPNYKTHLSSTG